MKKIIFLCLCFLLVGCSFGKKDNRSDFQIEFEKYNDQYLKLDLSDDKVFYMATSEEVNDVLSNGSGVILIGKAQDNLTRRVVKVLKDTALNTGLDNVYYLSSFDQVNIDEDIPTDGMPIVIFVVDGKVVTYHIGTIDDKVDLSEDEEISLYNIYVDGVHKVLKDACDEEC